MKTAPLIELAEKWEEKASPPKEGPTPIETDGKMPERSEDELIERGRRLGLSEAADQLQTLVKILG